MKGYHSKVLAEDACVPVPAEFWRRNRHWHCVSIAFNQSNFTDVLGDNRIVQPHHEQKDRRMNRTDLVNLTGTGEGKESEYVPVACLLNSGYGCLGYYNKTINENLEETLVLLNARLVDLRPEEGHSRRGHVSDFNDFLQDVVFRHVRQESHADVDELDRAEDTIPLTALPLREIAILYPVAQIATLLKSARKVSSGDRGSVQEIPTFLDFNNKSIVLKVLRTKLW